jgi:hypothetical protein
MQRVEGSLSLIHWPAARRTALSDTQLRFARPLAEDLRRP